MAPANEIYDPPSQAFWFFLTVFIGMAVLGFAGIYGFATYGDWRCGMPGVTCSRPIPGSPADSAAHD